MSSHSDILEIHTIESEMEIEKLPIKTGLTDKKKEKIKILFGDFSDMSDSESEKKSPTILEEGEIEETTSSDEKKKEQKSEKLKSVIIKVPNKKTCNQCKKLLDESHSPSQCALVKHNQLQQKWNKTTKNNRTTPYVVPLLQLSTQQKQIHEKTSLITKKFGQINFATPKNPSGLDLNKIKPNIDTELKRLYSRKIPKSSDSELFYLKKILKQRKTIVIEGNIGCGKTTLINNLQKISDFDTITIREPIEKWSNFHGINLLKLMYDNPTRWSSAFQSYALLTMLKNHLIPIGNNAKVMERCLLSTRYCFLENHKLTKTIDNVNASILNEWFEFSVQTTPINIDLIIYLQTTPENLKKRINYRNRHEEKKIEYIYLETLNTRYDNWLLHKKHPIPSPIIVINGNQNEQMILKELNHKIAQLFFSDQQPSTSQKAN